MFFSNSHAMHTEYDTTKRRLEGWFVPGYALIPSNVWEKSELKLRVVPRHGLQS